MLGSALHLLFAPIISAWLRMSSHSWRLLPTPGERPRAFAAGPNADRMLLVGSGVAVGYGVTSGDLALGGYLARGLSAVTRRGAAVETVAKLGLRVRTCSTVLEEFDLSRFDAVVLTLGSDEALHLVTPKTFRSALVGLLDWIDTVAPAGLGVVLVGIPDVTSFMKVPRVFERAVKRQCVLLNDEMTTMVRLHDRVTYLPFTPEPADLERDGDRRFYAAWATLMVPDIARVLDSHAADPRDPAAVEERRRQEALDALQILDTDAEPRFDRIVEDARALFGVRGASITFIDRDRQWSKAVRGMSPLDSPRGSALGDATVHNGKLLVVEDVRADARFSGHPWAVGSAGVRFFAGFPIEAANGERVGALCITDSNPRTFSPKEDALLGMLAQRVQAELWGQPLRDGGVRR